MKKILLILFILFGYNSFSQTIELIVSGGFNSSTQTLRSDGATQIGVSFNTIGGKQYQVDAYPGYHIKGLIGISKQLSNKTQLKLTSGLGYSSQGATVVSVNKTRITNNLNYIQIPILINFSFYKISFLFGPQISLLNNVNTKTKNSTILSLNALGNNPDFSYREEDFSNRDNGFVFGLEYKIYKNISASVKYITSLKNISLLDKETWKNKTIEISINYTLMNFKLNDKSIK
ncbi:MAG: outer membrane beta-barrel protein [Bacteroidota bacterium]|jgi:hypothetical protein|uniref:Outer membrane protein beta-barrel domain-containing protein n=1 Tax=marine metagenome TaxID=408172 RepID=A0A381R438_9ZZZZ|nr:outer membrane beta-barrel protein [Bacteroidota bacterium]|tara:strand:+ start:4762 stop:5457 length:696 start_codon:yes stop_codon:yes gene_type:complete